MIIGSKFIWEEDRYGYHITNIDAMKSICKEGLKPMLGDRSKSVGEDDKRIFFTYNLYEIQDWIYLLYEERNIRELELLRFNLKHKKWYGDITDNPQEFYLIDGIAPNQIEYLRLFDRWTNLPLTLDTNCHEAKVVWNGLDKYHPLVRKR